MSGVNRVTLIGHLGATPQKRFAASGEPVCQLRLATTVRYNDARGDRQERTEWHRVTAWGRLADLAANFMQQGSQVYVDGYLQTRRWYDPRISADRFTTEVVANDMQLLGPSTKQVSQQAHAKTQQADVGERHYSPTQQPEGYSPAPDHTQEDIPPPTERDIQLDYESDIPLSQSRAQK